MPFKIKNEAGEEVEVLTSAEQTEMITGAVNKSAKKLSADLTASLTTSIGEQLAKTLTDYETKRAEAAEAAEAERLEREAASGKGKGKGGEGAPTAVDVENSPAFRTLQKKFEAAVKAQETEAAARKAEAAKLKDTTLRQKLTEELDKNNFDPKRRHLAISHLVDGAKLVRWADDGESILFRDTDGDVDLASGLKSFAQTDDGKTFMPASGASGTGDRRGFGPITPKPNGKIDSNDLGKMALALMSGIPQSNG